MLGAGPAQAQPVWAVASGSTLVSFDSSTPGTLTSSGAITGLQPGESIVGIDFRQESDQLYGIGSTSRLYLINRGTGAAAQIGAQFTTLLSGTSFGFDHDPVSDAFRVISDADQNLLISRATGTVSRVDPAPVYGPDDENAAVNPAVVAIAYNPAFPGDLVGIDAAADAFVQLFGADGSTLSTIEPDLTETNLAAGFDLSPLGNGFAVISPPGEGSTFARVHREDGFTEPLAPVGANITGGMTLEPVPPQFVATPPSVDFGSQPVGTIGPARRIAVRNVGDAIPHHGLVVRGAHAADFLDAFDTCGGPAGGELGTPRDSCEIHIRFAPGAEGERSAVVRFLEPKGPEEEPLFDIPVKGTGVAPAAGSTGPTGAQGAAGSPGSAGSQGASGPRGRPGRDAVVRCTVRGRTRRVRVNCRVTPRARARVAHARLVRRGRVVATGSRAASMRARRTLRPGRYVLELTYALPRGRSVTVRRAARVR